MKILVTGGSGFIGSNLVRHLVARAGHQVMNVDKLTYAASGSSLRDVEGHSGYRFERVDICDGGTVARLLDEYRPDAMMHLAAESHVDRSIDSPAEFVATNIVGTYTLLEAAYEYWRTLAPAAAERFRFLHVSTDEVYGSLEPDDAPFTEMHPYDPRSPYSASKAASDHLVRAWWHTYGLPTIVTNCSNNYGPYQYPEKLIPTVIIKCLRHEPIPVYGDGQNVRDWLYVIDHVEALTTVLEHGAPGATYNIGGRNERRNIDLVKDICALLDAHAPNPAGGPYAESITFVPDRPGHDRRYAMDITKIEEELGWVPRHSPSQALEQTVVWYLRNAEWWEPLLQQSDATRRRGLARFEVAGEGSEAR